MFDKINHAQVAWYQMQFILDEKEKYELLRDVAEHNAMFTNYDAVKKVREAREKENVYEVPNEEFKQFVKDTFGKEMPGENKELSPEKVLEITRKGKYKEYIDMDLDEVTFIPYKKD